MSTISHPAASRRGMLLVFCAAVLWGTVGVATQAIFRQSAIDAVTVGFFRLAIAFPVLALLCLPLVGRGAQVEGRFLLRMLITGVMLAVYQVLYFAAIRDAGVAVATLVTLCTAPVLVALLSALFLREPFTRQSCGALLLALAGTVCLVGTPQQVAAQGTLGRGILLALGSATGYAVVTVLGRSLAGRHHPLQATTVCFGAGALVLLPFMHLPGVAVLCRPGIWGLLLYVGLVPTALSYLLFFLGMRYIRATTASVLTLVEPLTATILAWLLFDERLGGAGLLGAGFLCAAIALLYRQGNSGG